MGKRKKSSRKPAPAKQKVPLGVCILFVLGKTVLYRTDTAFTCLFCHHDKSVSVRLDRKEGVAQLVCRVCDQRYQSKVNRGWLEPADACWVLTLFEDLTEPIDIYSEWIDAADAAQREEHGTRRPTTSSSRAAPAPALGDSDEE